MILVVVCRILVSLADTYITIPASPESVVSGEAPDTVTGSESGVGGREGGPEPATTTSRRDSDITRSQTTMFIKTITTRENINN